MKPALIFIAAACAGTPCISIANIEPVVATVAPAASTNAERKAILDAVRQEIKNQHGLEVVFVVKRLRIISGWAWLHALPQSRDGKNHYEDVVALLHKRDGRWLVADMPCSEEDNPDCIGNPEFLNKLQQRIKGIPPEMLPP